MTEEGHTCCDLVVASTIVGFTLLIAIMVSIQKLQPESAWHRYQRRWRSEGHQRERGDVVELELAEKFVALAQSTTEIP